MIGGQTHGLDYLDLFSEIYRMQRKGGIGKVKNRIIVFLSLIVLLTSCNINDNQAKYTHEQLITMSSQEFYEIMIDNGLSIPVEIAPSYNASQEDKEKFKLLIKDNFKKLFEGGAFVLNTKEYQTLKEDLIKIYDRIVKDRKEIKENFKTLE